MYKLKEVRSVRLANVDGMVPVKSSEKKLKYVSCVNNPISVGIVFPTSELPNDVMV